MLRSTATLSFWVWALMLPVLAALKKPPPSPPPPPHPPAPPSPPALNKNCAPGGNFNLSVWKLLLPTGTPGKPTTIPSTKLVGCNGYHDANFYTNAGDGTMVMVCPGDPATSGCIPPEGGQNCRTELRETTPVSWDLNAATNLLKVSLAVISAGGSKRGTAIGKVHFTDDGMTEKPLSVLYCSDSGAVVMRIVGTAANANGTDTFVPIGSVMPGHVFSYVIAFNSGALSVSLNGASPVTVQTQRLAQSQCYFKAGNSNEGSTSAVVHFFSLATYH